MQQLNTMLDAPGTKSPGLSLSIASALEEINEVQRLRYQVLIEDAGLSGLANSTRLGMGLRQIGQGYQCPLRRPAGSTPPPNLDSRYARRYMPSPMQ
ncbi:hypothetical protein [Noviherbaspirillum aerium]|uniref:hypothetical protein n=1 Tax=Noviherbaspirillum aerium TaxID=2588497 RepID=UPI00124F4A13|nr:hypothetical protein [Noviherbaspirillum aerium]